jgi:GR25 family glycosyltransferase involved in LPS biosynthesis
MMAQPDLPQFTYETPSVVAATLCPGIAQIQESTYDFRNDCEFYCVSYNSPERAHQMTERFAKMDISLNIHTGVQMNDPRLAYTNDIQRKRVCSVFYGHIDNLTNFYNTGKKYGFTCEDDVHIHKDLAKRMPTIIREFEEMKLDILLLGYMTTAPIKDWWTGYHFKYPYDESRGYQYHAYPDHQWGIHLAMVSREYAKRIMDTFTPDYAERAQNDTSLPPPNPDWSLTKLTTERALLYPMVAVEDGKGIYDHWGQGEYHRNSHRTNYVEGEFY